MVHGSREIGVVLPSPRHAARARALGAARRRRRGETTRDWRVQAHDGGRPVDGVGTDPTVDHARAVALGGFMRRFNPGGAACVSHP